jgi:hypothetical protein
MRLCKKCTNKYEDGFTFCPHCGAEGQGEGPIIMRTWLFVGLAVSVLVIIVALTIQRSDNGGMQSKNSPAGTSQQNVTPQAQPSAIHAESLQEKKAVSRDQQTAPSDLSSRRPIEETLAIIDRVQFDAIKVKRFRSVLNQLASKYPENQQQIGDMTAKAYQILEGKGVSESLLNIMEGMNLVCPTHSPKGYNYSTTISMYMVLRDTGRSHQNTIEDMADILSNPSARQMVLDKLRNER